MFPDRQCQRVRKATKTKPSFSFSKKNKAEEKCRWICIHEENWKQKHERLQTMYKNSYISFQAYVQTNDPGCLPENLKRKKERKKPVKLCFKGPISRELDITNYNCRHYDNLKISKNVIYNWQN